MRKLMFLAVLLMSATNTYANQKLTPSANTADYCANYAWGAEIKLNDTCTNLYNKCKSGKMQHKGCKAFVKRWNKLSDELGQ